MHPACFVRFLPHQHKDGILSSSPQGTSVNLENMALVYTEQQGSSATRSVWTARENKTRNKRGVTGLLNSCEDPEQSTSRLVIAHPSKSPGSVCWLLFFSLFVWFSIVECFLFLLVPIRTYLLPHASSPKSRSQTTVVRARNRTAAKLILWKEH